eukprot:TRINITY_DN6669_c0_g1_i2.p1 TRINITY_DN6669_c0_g1~~TRINITY_DN6669_c0_g1_i2.p1  ORF type:complete len:548 (-),score=82.90 TRINITY_DN6669_c0_g1_i2:35-1678(-)
MSKHSTLWGFVDQQLYNCVFDFPTNELVQIINEKQKGLTPLHLACLRKSPIGVVEHFLENGADPNIICKKRTPAYLVTLYGLTNYLYTILQHGGNPDISCSDITPLHLASAKGMVEICDVLYTFGADISPLSKAFGTPLHVAVKKNHQVIATYLIMHGADISLKDANGETPLHISSKFGQTELVDLMLDKINLEVASIRDNFGNTALHMAGRFKHLMIIEKLVEKFPDLVPIRNNNEVSSLFYMSPNIRSNLRDIYVDHLSKRKGLHYMFSNELYSDLTISSSIDHTKKLYCHKAILWARWPLLRNRIELETDIIMEDVSYDTLKAFIFYIYTDTVPKMDSEELENLLPFAKEQELHILTSYCEFKLGGWVMIPASTFNEDLANLAASAKFGDVQFSTTNSSTVFLRHKCILACNTYFRTMFNIPLRESTSGEIEIMEMSSDVFHSIITYIYSKQFNHQLCVETPFEFLEASNRFFCSDLRSRIEAMMIPNITKDNVLENFIYADAYQAYLLKEECIDTICADVTLLESIYEELSPNLQENIRSFMK